MKAYALPPILLVLKLLMDSLIKIAKIVNGLFNKDSLIKIASGAVRFLFF